MNRPGDERRGALSKRVLRTKLLSRQSGDTLCFRNGELSHREILKQDELADRDSQLLAEQFDGLIPTNEADSLFFPFPDLGKVQREACTLFGSRGLTRAFAHGQHIVGSVSHINTSLSELNPTAQ